MPAQQVITLPGVLSDRLLEIPDYQRPYAWELKQLEDLWEDLDLLGAGAGTHYAGTLVLRDVMDGAETRVSVDQEGTTLRHCETVDGQQRITTCILMLDRISRRFARLADEGVEDARPRADKLRSTYAVVKINNASVPKLRLAGELNGHWTNVILGDGIHASPDLLGGQARLDAAKQFFDDRLDALVGTSSVETFERLCELQRRITAGLRFLVYEVASVVEVGVIFETLNERGRPLSDLEKAKNYLLYLARQIPDDRQEELATFINEKWAEIFRNLSRLDGDVDDQLLRSHWLATQNPDARAWKRIASLKARFDRGRYVSSATRLVPVEASEQDAAGAHDLLFADVKEYVESLRRCSFYLSEMFDPRAAFTDFGPARSAVLDRSSALARSGVVAIFRPLLCAARLRYPSDGDFYARLVDMCERYAARVFVISQRRANAGQAKLFALAHELCAGTRSPEATIAGIATLLWRYADDDRVASMLGHVTENWYTRRGHKYFLFEYELHLRKQGDMPISFGDFITSPGAVQRTTEHILPQNPKGDADCWWSVFTEEQHANLRHALGNLCLTLDNSSYSNKCFASKRGMTKAATTEITTCYAQASLHQERELAAIEAWTPATIRERQQRLAVWALDRWAVVGPSVADVESEDLEPDIEDEAAE